MELANSTATTCYNRKQLLHFLVVEQHPVDLGDGHVSRLLRLKVDKPIALRIPLFIEDHLTGEDISKSTEGVVECFVVNSLVQVLDEDVTYTRTPEGGVTLGPHDAHRSSLDHLKVHCVQGSLSYLGGMNTEWGHCDTKTQYTSYPNDPCTVTCTYFNNSNYSCLPY